MKDGRTNGLELWDSTAAALLFASTGGSSWRNADSFGGGASFSLVSSALRFSLFSSISASRIICAMKSSDEMGVAIDLAAAFFALFFSAVEPHPERA
jgi:hypothetical protein